MPTGSQIESREAGIVCQSQFSHMSRVICIPDLTPFILEEVHASNFYLMKVSCIQKYNAGNATLNWARKFIESMAICPNSRQGAQTLYDLISEHLEFLSTIHVDAWRGYNGLLAGGFANHLAVNHSLHFINLITHMHTNNIVFRWRSLRHRLSGRNSQTNWTPTIPSICGTSRIWWRI